ncbi:SusC/RagA family TonB-linked outer membrane protein [Puteibacter caeruleilacunae]|nr:SusC/RagA family TonB-linked outer membrane protein [Puteibacter caeruleilacunae]
MKKNECWWGCYMHSLRKLTRIMRITIVILLVSLLQVKAVESFSQESKISLEFKDTRLEEVIDLIEAKSGYSFLFDQAKINVERRVNMKITKKNLDEILTKLFDGSGVKYMVIDKQIILSQVQKMQKQKPSTITGTVTDENGEGIPGVSIVIEGTTIGVVTDLDGSYSIDVGPEAYKLIFSFVGMRTVVMELSNQEVIDVVLQSEAIGLEEIVAVGYGTQIKRKITSAVSNIKAEEALESRPIVSVQQGLSGMDASLDVAQSNGRPGSFPGLTIRGTGNPIVLVDGFESSISDVDPSQIKEISILKDAAAAAVYGLRAADGVILITTKSGQKNKAAEFSYGVQTSWQGYTDIPMLTNTVDYMKLRNKAELNEQLYINGLAPAEADDYAMFSQDVIDRAEQGEFFDTNWPDIVYGESAMQMKHNLSVSGGTKKTIYSLALGYMDQDGVNISDAEGFQRYNLRLKLETDVNEWLTVGTNTSYTHRDQTTVPVEAQRGLRAVPYYPVYDHLGSGLYAVGDGGTSENPVLKSNNGSQTDNLRDALEIQLNAKVKIAKGLSFEENVGFRILNSNSKAWTNVIDFASLEFDGQTGEYSSNPISYAQSSSRKLQYSSTRSSVITSQSLLRYKWSNDNHFIKVLAGWQTEEVKSEGFDTQRQDFLNESVHSLGVGGVDVGLTNSSDASESSDLSALGRVNYDYRGKYLVEFSWRYDISSQFAKGNRSGFFPSVSLGWNVANENFMQNLDFVSQFKLRGSWGEVGRDNVPSLSYIQRVNQNKGYPWSTGMEPGLVIANYASPDLTWETHEKINLGVDIGLLDGKFNIVADVFRNRKNDILADVAISDEFGLPAPDVNKRSNEYRGWEVAISHRNRLGDFGYNVMVNASNVRSKWVSLGGEEPSYGSSLRKECEPVGIAYGYRANGLISSQEELDQYLANHTFAGPNSSLQYIGAPMLVDISGPDGVPDGQIDSEYDREIIDDKRGDYRVGMHLGVSYKNISLNAVISGVFDRSVYATGGQSENQFSGGVGNAFEIHKESFDPDSPDKFAPYPLIRSGLINYDRSSYWMRKASYIRVRNINVKYAFNKSLLGKTNFIKRAELFTSIENPFMIWNNFFASDTGWDPELGIGNVDYPLPRTITIGANITF